jgi:hypothetical protein
VKGTDGLADVAHDGYTVVREFSQADIHDCLLLSGSSNNGGHHDVCL